jgi:DNA invertase Pin-like site-specific DNA recombinase
MRLVGYVRVSRVGGREGDSFISPDVQRDAVEAYARAHGHELVAWQEDLDEPGSRLRRPGFDAALAAVERGEAEGIIAAKLDRLTRSIADLGRLLERSREEGWTLIAVDVGLDPKTPQGKLVANVLGSVAEWELDRKREDWSTAQARAVARGVHIASRTPTGYRRREDGRLEPDSLSAAVIRELFRRRAAGAGWKELCDFMDGAQVAGPYANASWAPRTLQHIVANRVYLGEARSGKHVNEQAHEPIVPRGEWEAAQGVRVGRSPRNGDGLLLAGLVRCAGCRYVVKADHMRDRDGSRLGLYRCRARHPGGRCPTPTSSLARVLDPWVEERFLDALGPDGPLAQAIADTEDAQAAEAELETAEAELAAYRDDTLISVIGRAAYHAGLEKRAAVVDAARATLTEARRRSQLAELLPATPGSLVNAWGGLRVAERRTILRAAIDAVILRPVRGGGSHVPIAERALILWRGQAPTDLPRRGIRVPLAPFAWPEERPADLGVTSGEDAEPRTLDRRPRRRGKRAHVSSRSSGAA